MRSFAKGFYWQGWRTVGAVATSLVAISTAIVAIFTFFVASRTLQANTRQQTSDRFVKAIEQLGNATSPDVRIGGIYGLEQLARDSPSDHPAVFDVLTAFVRSHAKAVTGHCGEPQAGMYFPAADVQAAVDAIARRDRTNDRKDQVLDLSDTCLRAARWGALQLSGISLAGADLWGAFLDAANLTGATLVGANLTTATLGQANLTKADLAAANFTKANLSMANLTEAALYAANLTAADLDQANLTGARLGGADLTGADLTGANLTGAELRDIRYNASTSWPAGFRPPPSR